MWVPFVLLGELGFFISAGCVYWAGVQLECNFFHFFLSADIMSDLKSLIPDYLIITSFLILFTLTKIVIMEKVSISIIILLSFSVIEQSCSVGL
jgi:hypothetical protein